MITATARKPEDVADLFADAWNDKDATALARLFAEDADFVNVVGLWWRNRADIERAHRYGLTTFFKASNLSARWVKVRRVGDNVAIVHARWKLSGQLDKQGNTLNDRTTIMTFVAERREDRWIVVSSQNTDVVPGMETFAAKGKHFDAVNYRK